MTHTRIFFLLFAYIIFYPMSQVLAYRGNLFATEILTAEMDQMKMRIFTIVQRGLALLPSSGARKQVNVSRPDTNVTGTTIVEMLPMKQQAKGALFGLVHQMSLGMSMNITFFYLYWTSHLAFFFLNRGFFCNERLFQEKWKKCKVSHFSVFYYPRATQSTLHVTPGVGALAYSRVQPHTAIITTDQVPIYTPGWREAHLC